MYRQGIRKTLEERFWEKVEKTEGCWLWTANATKDREGNRRYGLIGAGRRGEGTLYAHRVSWEIHNGPVPQDMYVLHRCDNPCCVNPLHLFLGAQVDNMQDMTMKGRRGATGPVPDRGYRVTRREIRLIIHESASMSNRDIAKLHLLNEATIGNILLGKSHIHVG